ncbi:hypothetical protein LJR143_002177 [Pseudoxanthomonas sp. LjRoot143]|uniref:hypothetical protein n=1 Tax=Pseudoxanthomonas sp. LjRoot143 TaxID=3342266 RepID=UPI003ECC4F42
MARTFSRFDAAVIGDGQMIANAGLEIVSVGEELAGHARADLPGTSDVRGAEFVFYGDTEYTGVVGLVDDSQDADAIPGVAAGTVGWRLPEGAIAASGTVIATELEIPEEQTIVGMVLDESLTPPRLRFYIEAHLVGYVDLHPGAFAAHPFACLADVDAALILSPEGEAISLL